MRRTVLLLRRGGSLAAAAAAAGTLGGVLLHRGAARAEPADSAASDEQARLRAELARLRRGQEEMRKKWAADDLARGKLPARAWPERQPTAAEVPALRDAHDRCVAAAERRWGGRWAGPWHDGAAQGCGACAFELATGLVFGGANPHEGLRLYHGLAESGDADGMVATGICLVDGFDGEVETADQEAARGAAGVGYLLQAAARGSAQGCYELGVCFYIGNVVPEDEARACALFRRAAEQQHTSGLFMYGDCLLEGTGVERDGASGVRYILRAAERGHRGARARLMALLTDDGQVPVGNFTDGSRQTVRPDAELE